MNNNNSDEYERKDNVTDDNDGDECLDKDGIDIVQKYLYLRFKNTFGYAFGQVAFRSYSGNLVSDDDAFNSNKAM